MKRRTFGQAVLVALFGASPLIEIASRWERWFSPARDPNIIPAGSWIRLVVKSVGADAGTLKYLIGSDSQAMQAGDFAWINKNGECEVARTQLEHDLAIGIVVEPGSGVPVKLEGASIAGVPISLA